MEKRYQTKKKMYISYIVIPILMLIIVSVIFASVYQQM